METWKGFFTEREVYQLVNCINTHTIKDKGHNNKDNLKNAINDNLGEIGLRDSIINKLESLSQEEVNEIISACEGIARQHSYKDAIESVFNPQPET